MLYQRPDIFCKNVLHEKEERIRHIMSDPLQYYQPFEVKKKSGGTRTIDAPCPELKAIQRHIYAYLVQFADVPAYVFGGIKGKDAVHNAAEHKKQKYVFQTDIKSFFPHITAKMVYETMCRVGFSADVARIITKLTTIKKHLPQGSPASPYIANLAFVPCGNEIAQFCNKYGLVFTTYIDDVTISADWDFKLLTNEVLDIMKSHGFKISYDKTSFKSGTKVITGVELFKGHMNPPKGLLEKLKSSEVAPESKKGILAYCRMIAKTDQEA